MRVGRETLIPIRKSGQVDLKSELEIWLAEGKLGAQVTKIVPK
jgi:hypothetical protein